MLLRETIGSLFSDALRSTEYAKIEYGRKHFKAMESIGIAYEVVDDFDQFLVEVSDDS